MALATYEPLVGLTPRVQEIGRIRMGEKGDRGQPVKLKTFRLTANDPRVLEVARSLYGGQVRPWKDAPDEGMYQLTTAAAELDILIPRSLLSVTQRYELWKGGTCERRCDGRIEELTEAPCVCGDQRGEDGYCDIVTRLSVILPRIPGLGRWRLDTGGWHAASTLPATLDLLLALDGRSMVPAVLRAVQASTKVRDLKTGKVVTHRFVKPVLDAPGITIGQMVGAAATEAAQLPETVSPRQMTAEERVARQRAAIEQRQTTSAADEAAHGEAVPAADAASPPAEPSSPAPGEVETQAVGAAAPSPESPDEEVIEGEVREMHPAAMTDQELRDWLRERYIGLTDAQKHIRAAYGEKATIGSITDEQRAATAAAVAHPAQ